MSDYDSRRTGNGLLDTGSTPVWSTFKKFLQCFSIGVLRTFFVQETEYALSICIQPLSQFTGHSYHLAVKYKEMWCTFTRGREGALWRKKKGL